MEYDLFGFSIKDRPLYEFTTSPSSPSPLGLVATTSTAEFWHRRLVHPGRDAASHLDKDFAIPCNKATMLCHACQLGKHVRLLFSRSQTICVAPFQLIHCDLWTSPVVSNFWF
jgi:hypothetical protein